MRLSELIEQPPVSPPPASDVEIQGLAWDSRDVQPGYLFAALAGTQARGTDFIPDAVAHGAVAVLAPEGTNPDVTGSRVSLVTDPNPRRRLALMAARFYGVQPKIVACVTGTNGKSSVADFTRQIWKSSGRKAGVLGSLGAFADGFRRPLRHTTPDPVTLHRLLAEFAGEGIDHLALEASSHGLEQHRLDGVRVAAAAFTNLTRDHMDYHADSSAYLAAKAGLFERVMEAGGTAVLNADDDAVAGLAETCLARGQRVLRFGTSGADIQLISRRDTAAGQELKIAILGKEYEFTLPLPGGFQALNALAATGLAMATDVDPEVVIAGLENLTGVRGRLEEVAGHPAGARVFVDYAHTPDALSAALRAVRPLVSANLLVVFGCGGDRDVGKRREMGEVAASLADHAIVTDDNPRHEDATSIRQMILDGCPEATEVADRAEAIRMGIESLDSGDVLLIAGKGHEQGQTVGDRVIDFDDAAVAHRILLALEEGRA
jgi:UDP-N-acetylmuramoyl-L-alanyl-D-glutamate--2,6-diaminopimelate ligase